MTEESEKKAIDIIGKAQETAKNMVETAEATARLLLEKSRKETAQMIVDSIKQAFGQGEEEQKIVRLNRIPYICEDIRDIKKDIKRILWIVALGIGGLTVVTFTMPIVIPIIVGYFKK